MIAMRMRQYQRIDVMYAGAPQKWYDDAFTDDFGGRLRTGTAFETPARVYKQRSARGCLYHDAIGLPHVEYRNAQAMIRKNRRRRNERRSA
jgi:hypothetical protein